MADDDLTFLIRERQRKAACEAAGIPYVPDVLAVREAGKCDPEIPAVEDALLDANPMPETVTVPRVLPRPLVVRSPAVTVVCEVGSGTATSAYDESSIEMYLDDISEIARTELYRIAGNRDAIQAVLDTLLEPLASGGITAAEFDTAMMVASTVEATAAAGIRRKSLELRGSAGTGGGSTGLYAIAELTALSRLVCTFSSPEVWIVCDSSQISGVSTSLTAPVPLPPDSSFRYRSAGFAVSEVSDEDALDLAVRDAVADPTFTCVYTNTPVTVTCADLDPAFDLTYSPAFTWNGNSYTTLAELGAEGFEAYSLDSLVAKNQLIFSVSTAVFSASTQEEADARALAAALDQLNCFFPSREMVVDCENRSLDNAVTRRMDEADMTKEAVFLEMDAEYSTLDPSLVTNYGILPFTPGPGADIDTSEGLRVEVPAGMVVSQVSTADADSEARAHALGFLSCFWVSPEVTCSCVAEAQGSPAPGSYWWTTAELTALKAPLRVSSSTGLLTFAKGELGSSEDGFIDVSDAMGICKASLVCIYCNETIDPRCHILNGDGDDLWSGTDEGLPLALTSMEGVSSGISAGLPSGVICDSDPELVNTLAISTGSLPPLLNGALGVPVCRYGNLEISKTCAQKVGDDAFALTPDAQGRSLTVAAGAFDADTQAAADLLAEAFLEASLICEFGNPPMTILCGASAESIPPLAAEYTGTPAVYGTGLDVIAPGSAGGVATPVSVAAHTFTSLESPNSAKAQALVSGVAQLNCFWRNARVLAKCESPPYVASDTDENGTIELGTTVGYHPDGTLTVETLRGTIDSYISQRDANANAWQLAHSALDCYYGSAAVSLRCGAPKQIPDAKKANLRLTPIAEGTNAPNYSTFSTGAEIGDEVTSPIDLVISYISQIDANTQSYDLAHDQLDCFWESAKVDLKCTAPQECPPAYYGYDETQEIQLGGVNVSAPKEPLAISPEFTTYSEDSTGYNWGEAVTDARTVISYISQGDANRQAYRMAWSLLDCYWASARVELQCIPLAKPTTEMLLKGETETIASGTVTATLVTTAAKDVTSYRNQADANMQAYRLTAGQLDCDTEVGGGNALDWQYHAFSLTATPGGGGGGGSCCAVRLDPDVEAAGLNVLKAPDADGVYNTDVVINPNGTALPGSCAPVYFYLKALLHAPRPSSPLYARYYATAGEVEASAVTLPDLEGTAPDYNIVRRLIAYAQGAEDDCSDLQIIQLVTKPQKIVTSLLGNGGEIPAIVDDDAPLPGVSQVSFKCSYDVATASAKVGPGKYEYPLGTFVSVAENAGLTGSYIYARLEQTAAGALASFAISGEPSELPFTQRDTTDKFVEYSNVLLAEVSGSTVTQHRVGNLSLLHRLINGAYCLWAESTGGSS